ncbi:MAG: hypothetical protein IJU35_00285, partial [Paludibacteraceae bacterium]|nr:hypothetical protein [Paludibacteraceae bacterium]
MSVLSVFFALVRMKRQLPEKLLYPKSVIRIIRIFCFIFERIFVFERGSYAGIMTEQKAKRCQKETKKTI